MMKSKFLTELVARDIDDKTAELKEELVFQSGEQHKTIVAPKGFVTDFASVPRLPIVYFLFGNTARKPAVIHDWLYQTHLMKRSDADKVFLEAMEVAGIPLWKRWDMYLGVKLGGWWSYKSGPKRIQILGNSCLLTGNPGVNRTNQESR